MYLNSLPTNLAKVLHSKQALFWKENRRHQKEFMLTIPLLPLHPDLIPRTHQKTELSGYEVIWGTLMMATV